MKTYAGLTLVLAFCGFAAVAQETTSLGAESQPFSSPRRTLPVSGRVIITLVEHASLPEYPEAAIKAGLKGDVIFRIIIDETGKIILSEPVAGQPLLIAASMEALREFRFRPYQLNGTPIQVESVMGVRFELQGKGGKAKGKVEYMPLSPYSPEFRTMGKAGTATGAYTLWARKVSGPEPQLPPALAGKTGSVYLTVVIGTDGKVRDVKVIYGDSRFVDPVVNAVKQFVYEPQLVAGKPTVATIEASYHFGQRQ